MRRIIVSLFYIFQSVLIFSQVIPLENKLSEIPDIKFTILPSSPGFEAAYELSVKQALDHSRPEKGFFYQRVFLSHSGFDKPVVFVTEGYDQPQIYYNELSELLGSNQVEVEHRYYGISKPDSMDYTFLTVEQEAADLHHINQVLKKIYNGKWISTGISKGGQNSIFYNYFYPEDVDATVAYVAPLNLSTADKRIFTFLDTISSRECRNKITDFQVKVLRERDKILPLLEEYSKNNDFKYTYLSFEQAFEYTVLEYSFSFWQWGHNCSEIPEKNSSIEDVVTHLTCVSSIGFFSDITMEKYASHYYQSAKELGYYSYCTDDFSGLLIALPSKPYPSAVFTPGKIDVEYDDSLAKKVNEWTQTSGNGIIYIYGAADTWSATSVPPSDKTNSVWFFLNDANHRSARIKYMNDKQKSLFVNTLEEWTGLDIE